VTATRRRGLALSALSPDNVSREVQKANNSDLLLTSGSRTAVVEVKLGHLMSEEQQKKYEALTSHPDLYLAALASDRRRLRNSTGRWSFLSRNELVGRWESAGDDLPVGSCQVRMLGRDSRSLTKSRPVGVMDAS
jgi:hypothetical protein